MYRLSTSLLEVAGVGEKLFAGFEKKGVTTIRELLLTLPLHYVDRSQLGKITDLNQDKEITFVGEVTTTSNFYRKPRSIQSATVKDETGRVKLLWFNNKFILKKLKKGEKFLISGKLGKKGGLVHPQVEDVVIDSVHTGRIVPVYTATFGIQIGRVRRIIKEILDNLEIEEQYDIAHIIGETAHDLVPIKKILDWAHYPETKEDVVAAKERLALEELLLLIKKSNQIKKEWSALAKQKKVVTVSVDTQTAIPSTIPFTLTPAQQKVTAEILADLSQTVPMNRLLIGDVGSGKTVVAGIGAYHLIQQGQSVALVAPTKILAAQHFETIQKLFPDLPIHLLSVGSSLDFSQPGLYIGTHGLINRFTALEPALIIYDEQHRFGVGHRSSGIESQTIPHVLTMTATPIPRTLMLTIFSHLQVSVIDEMPPGRLPVETYLVSEKKRSDSYQWIDTLFTEDRQRQVIVVCPFIEASENEAFDSVANVTDKFEELSQIFKKKYVVAQLHGRMNKKEQTQISADLFSGKIDILVTTPIVEVGVDLPTATVIVIENAERFGLASLHQLRGRVGRRGQQGYCLLFSQSKTTSTRDRLKVFCEEKNGMKLAEFDLQNRGAGDIFGLEQSGLDTLTFANWTNVELISQARRIYNQLDFIKWQPLLANQGSEERKLPLAN